MLPLGEAHEEDNLEFRWGRKKSVAVRNKDVQFYTSFTNGGVEYFLYDCVYLRRDNELDIGKIVRLCESARHEKLAKVVWFFRPIEVRQWLGDVEPLWNEVFLASGEGKGLCNVNPLETICGKCNVVCTSKDKRNPQATREELKMADYIFCRTFDVARCTISPIFADVIAGTEVKHFFNREKDQKFTASEDGANLNGKIANPSSFVKVEGNEGVMDLRNPEKDDKTEMKRELNVSPTSSSDIESRKKRKLQFGDVGPEEDPVKLSITLPRVPLASDFVIHSLKHSNGDKGSKFDNQFQDVTRRPVEGVTVLRNPEKDGKFDTSSKLAAKDKGEMKRVQDLSTTSSFDRESPKRRKLQFNDVGPKEDPVKLSNTLPRVPDAPDSAIKILKHYDKGSKFDNQFQDVTRRPVEGVTVLRNPEKDGKFDTSPKPATKDKGEMKRVQDLSTTSLFDSESPKRGELQFNDVGPKEDPVKLSDTLPRVPDALESAIKNLKHYDKGSKFDNKFQEVTRRPVEGVTVFRNPEKGGKFDTSPRLAGKVGSKEDPVKLSDTLPRKPDAPDSAIKNLKHSNGDKGSKSNNQILEVTRRPAAETSKWFEQQPWGEKMKSANDRGTLVLLENLDPSYTSSEVQDIIWSAFNVTGEAKIIPRCALSSPHHGQAFFIFKSEDAADHAISDLKRKCLMLPNGRPLVGRKGCPVEPKNCTKFVGHLVIEKLKFRKQNKDWKIAVSTSHYSQPNTIEYDMAAEWLLLQEKSKLQWDALNKQHAKEIERLRSQLKTHHDLLSVLHEYESDDVIHFCRIIIFLGTDIITAGET
ncbi:hypothetical protein Vadar_028622 [Vaccinium darrowii]|uniref:Uncharacterized protein n=1 Tax=Vaccinium darrowii TaxID=229202 RepID=A0ACB7ZMH9_9ERIC|nr:hypothetical protein Vadar_028622 [Vaccinium darrowii]